MEMHDPFTVTELIPNQSAEAMAARYMVAVEQAVAAAEQGQQAINAMNTIFDERCLYHADVQFPSPDTVRVRFKKAAWRGLVKKVDIRSMLTAEKAQALENELERGELPDVTPEAITQWVRKIVASLPDVMEEAIWEAWHLLQPNFHERGYVTNARNEGVGAKVILSCICYRDPYSNVPEFYNGRKNLNAIDLAFHLLDGKGAPKYPHDACTVLETSLRAKAQECESEYLKMKWFKNGNVHLQFRRMDLVQKMNAMCAGKRMGKGHGNQ